MGKKFILIITILIFSFSSAFTQTTDSSKITSDTISYIKNFWGVKYIYQGSYLNINNLKNIVKDCPEAFELANKSIANYYIAYLLSFSGGTIIGFPVSQAVVGSDMNWQVFLIGCGVVVLSMPFGIISSKQLSESVKLYNDYVKESSKK